MLAARKSAVEYGWCPRMAAGEARHCRQGLLREQPCVRRREIRQGRREGQHQRRTQRQQLAVTTQVERSEPGRLAFRARSRMRRWRLTLCLVMIMMRVRDWRCSVGLDGPKLRS